MITNEENLEMNGQENMGNNIPANNTGNAPAFVTLLVLSIIQTCCCCNLITGILALVFTFLANSSYKEGNDEKYEFNKKVAIISLCVGLGLTILWSILSTMGAFTSIPMYNQMIEEMQRSMQNM